MQKIKNQRCTDKRLEMQSHQFEKKKQQRHISAYAVSPIRKRAAAASTPLDTQQQHLRSEKSKVHNNTGTSGADANTEADRQADEQADDSAGKL